MATCPFCHGFRDDTYECECRATYYEELDAGRIPPGLTAETFNYDVWRKIRGIENALQLHPELTDEWAQERLAKVLTEARESAREAREYFETEKQKQERLAHVPRRRLY